MKRVIQATRWLLVTVGVIALTSVTVDATLGGRSVSQSALGILATTLRDKTEAGCPEGTVRLGGDLRSVCVDIYEASPGEHCPQGITENNQATLANMQEADCRPVSAKGARPWVYVTYLQAQELCARAGKHLLANDEWYRASVGTPDPGNEPRCNTTSRSLMQTAANTGCISGVGAYDMIGNAWEWVDARIDNGSYNGRVMPESGYVIETDTDGVAVATADQPNPAYYGDYAWTEPTGSYAMLRGGFYGSGEDAGVFGVQAKTAPSFSGNAVGFRCGSELKE